MTKEEFEIFVEKVIADIVNIKSSESYEAWLKSIEQELTESEKSYNKQMFNIYDDYYDDDFNSTETKISYTIPKVKELKETFKNQVNDLRMNQIERIYLERFDLVDVFK